MSSPANLRYITLAQIIGCCLVILGHSYPFITAVPSSVIGFRTFLYAFHMPLFVWCSGFLFAYTKQTERKTFKQYLSQRALKLLVPYFVISLIGLVPKILASSVLNDNLGMDVVQIVRAFFVPREGVWGHFWFLPMIFWLGLLGFALDKVTKTVKGWVWVTVIAFCLSFFSHNYLMWLGINDVLEFFVFFCLGVISCKVGWLETKSLILKLLSWGGVILSVLLFLAIHGNDLLIHVRNFVIATLMIASIVQLCKYLEKRTTIDRQSLIAQTYQIYILSWPCQLVAGIIVERLLHLSWFFFIPIVFIVGVLMPLLLILVIDYFEKKTNTKFLSLIIGR